MREHAQKIVGSAEIRLATITPVGIQSPRSTPISFKQAVKAILQKFGLYHSPHGRIVSKTFFVDVFVKPAVMLDCELLVRPMRNRGWEDAVYVNDRQATVRRKNNRFFIDPKLLYEYENLITLPLSAGIKSVELRPVIDANHTPQSAVLAASYEIKENNKPVEIVKNGFGDQLHSEPLIDCLLQSQISDAGSPFVGLYYPAFDVDGRSYRLCSWTWANAVIVEALLTCRPNDQELRSRALALAQRLLDFQETSGEEAGGLMARWDILNQTPGGITPQIATNDSAFIAAYAFLPAYQSTGESRFLDAATAVGDWLIRRGMAEDGQLYSGKRLDTGEWVRNYLFVDSGFTSRLFANLLAITGDPKWERALRLFQDWYIAHLFDSSEGYFWWNWYDFRAPAKTAFSRGQAWALDGVISAYEVTNSERYLNVACACADTLVEHQQADGSWTYHLKDKTTGADAKGTPILAYHLARLAASTGVQRYWTAAEKATNWCLNSCNTDDDDHRSRGGIAAFSTEGTMYGARNVVSVFMYAQAFLLLAQETLRREK